MKTSDLIGPALDWAVAKCSGDETRLMFRGDSEAGVTDVHFDPWLAPWSPSTDWAQGGLIIERECIDLYCDHAGVSWRTRKMLGERGPMAYGPTPLIAAMRCYVASKLGDEVDVPKELQ